MEYHLISNKEETWVTHRNGCKSFGIIRFLYFIYHFIVFKSNDPKKENKKQFFWWKNYNCSNHPAWGRQRLFHQYLFLGEYNNNGGRFPKNTNNKLAAHIMQSSINPCLFILVHLDFVIFHMIKVVGEWWRRINYKNVKLYQIF